MRYKTVWPVHDLYRYEIHTMNQDLLSADQVLKLRSPDDGPTEQFENISPRRTDC